MKIFTNGINWLCRDRKTGKIVLAQKPNTWLILSLTAVLIRILFDVIDAPNVIVRSTRIGSYIFFAIWSCDEIVRGVNPFRRLLGAGVLAIIMVAAITAV